MVEQELVPITSAEPASTGTQTLLNGASLYGTAMFDDGYYKFSLIGVCSEGLTPDVVDYPAATDTRAGIIYANGSITGNMTEPAPADVKQGIQYGANGTEFTGTYTGRGKKNFGFNF